MKLTRSGFTWLHEAAIAEVPHVDYARATLRPRSNRLGADRYDGATARAAYPSSEHSGHRDPFAKRVSASSLELPRLCTLLTSTAIMLARVATTARFTDAGRIHGIDRRQRGRADVDVIA